MAEEEINNLEEDLENKPLPVKGLDIELTEEERFDDDFDYTDIKNVIPLSNFTLLIEFESGAKRYCDVKEIIAIAPVFEPLKNKALFNRVRLEGPFIAWLYSEYILILSPLEIWYFGTSDAPSH